MSNNQQIERTCLPIGSDDEDANQMHERVVEAVVAILEANDD